MGNQTNSSDLNGIVQHDSIRMPVSDLIKVSSIKRKYKNSPSAKDFPSKDYAIMVDSRPQFPHAVKTAFSNLKPRNIFDAQTPVFYIREKNVYYQGSWEDGIPSGKGNIYFEEGYYFEGSFERGQAFCSDGLLIYPNGAVYQGNITNSTLHGFGKLTYPNQVMTYTGHWQQNLPHGIGQQVFGDGSRYEGHFVNGAKQGSGKFIFDYNEKQYNGSFVNGNAQGTGILRDLKQKTEYKGQFKQGMKNGHGKLFTKYGQLEGYFVNDFIVGRGIFKWQDGRIYIGEFKNNEMNGNGKIVYLNSQVVEGIWENGVNTSIGLVHNHQIPIVWSYMDPVLRVQYDGHLSDIVIKSNVTKS